MSPYLDVDESPRVCSVRYVPRYADGIYRRYYRYRTLRQVRYDINTGTGYSVSSVRHAYRYRKYRYRTEHTLVIFSLVSCCELVLETFRFLFVSLFVIFAGRISAGARPHCVFILPQARVFGVFPSLVLPCYWYGIIFSSLHLSFLFLSFNIHGLLACVYPCRIQYDCKELQCLLPLLHCDKLPCSICVVT